MAASVYILGCLLSLVCGGLLLRGFAQGNRRLLLWSGICFLGLSVSNFLVFLDLIVFPDVNLYRWRLITAAISMLLLIWGLVWEGD
jgi:hypothetical protein